MNTSDLLIKSLEAEGVRYIFGVPGEENLDFLESLRKSNIKLIVTRHEQGASLMAATMGRLTGSPGVCFSTLGPGATNLLTGAAYAQLGGMPMMMITGQKPIKKSKQGSFQIVDVVGMMRPLTKFTKTIVNGDLVPSLVREAFRRATEERPGAVHLELPEDIASEKVSADVFEITQVRRPVAETKAIQMAIEKIQKAKSPLLLIGAGANRKMTSKMLIELIVKTGLFFFSTQMGKGVIDAAHPRHLGTAALSATDYLHDAIKQADLIINVGHDTIEKPPFFMKRGGPDVIHINFFQATIDEVYFPQLEVVGDIANAIWQIKEQISPQSTWDFTYYQKAKKKIDQLLQKDNDDARFPVIPQRVVADVRSALPQDGMVALDNGMYKLWFARHFPANQPNTLLLDNALATMGAGLPSAIVAKLLFPNRKVLAVCGDGGFMMNSQELETAVRLKLDLVVLILNDNAFGMIKWKQAERGFKDFGLDYGNPDFVKYAKSYGAKGDRVKKTAQFLPLLKKCFNAKGVHLIELPIDYSESDRVFTQELKKKDHF